MAILLSSDQELSHRKSVNATEKSAGPASALITVAIPLISSLNFRSKALHGLSVFFPQHGC